MEMLFFIDMMMEVKKQFGRLTQTVQETTWNFGFKRMEVYHLEKHMIMNWSGQATLEVVVQRLIHLWCQTQVSQWLWTAKTTLSGQQTRLKASATNHGTFNHILIIITLVMLMLMQKKQKLSVSGGEIAVNQIGLWKMISMETFSRFTKNTKLSMMDKQ